tara:strand:+ start:181 stop:615 length:435 start_codon:yes stop_codon:yes gene_type:complete
MPLLHYRLTQNNQNITINAQIHAQSFILRRIIVQQVALGAAASVNDGGVIINPSHLSGLEIVSGSQSNNNDIIVGYDELIATHSQFYSQEFDSESIPQAFNVQTHKFGGNTGDDSLAVFGTDPGNITSIDVFFEFQSLFNYEGY